MKAHTILVVEDNAITRKMLRVALQTAGYGVVEAADAATALDGMMRASPDLVLQDLLLPDMDGLELVKRLRSQPGGNQVPILAISGLVSKRDQIKISSGGFNDFIAKPVEPSRLLQIVETFVPRPAAAPLGHGQLLLVDDDAVQRKLGRLTLMGLGFTVRTATDGEEALAAIRQQRPDVVVSDVLMPRLDGFQLCRRIRADPDLASLPVLLLLGGDAREFLERTGALCLSKPFSLDEVRRVVAVALNR